MRMRMGMGGGVVGNGGKERIKKVDCSIVFSLS